MKGEFMKTALAFLCAVVALCACDGSNGGAAASSSCVPEDLVGRPSSRAVECYGGACGTGSVPHSSGGTALSLSYCREGSCQACASPVAFDTWLGTITSVRTEPVGASVVLRNTLTRPMTFSVDVSDMATPSESSPVVSAVTLAPGEEMNASTAAFPPGVRVRLRFRMTPADGAAFPETTKDAQNVLVTSYRVTGEVTSSGLDVRWTRAPMQL